MRCPDTGTLRAALDGAAPAAVSDHVAACASCRADSERLQADAAIAARAVALLAPAAPAAPAAAVAPPVALRPPSPTTAPSPPPVPPAGARRPRRVAAVAAAIVALAVTVAATPAGRSAAADFLAAFRTERFEVVTVESSDEDAFAALEALGEVTTSGEPTPTRVADAAAAAEAVGVPVAVPPAEALPSSVTSAQPSFTVTEPAEVRLTFDADRIAAHLSAHGADPAAIPAGLDGAALVVHVPAAAAVTYPGDDDELPGLIVGSAAPVAASVDGDVSLPALREFLLDLPGLPPDTVRQLEQIQDWRTTLPIPVPPEVAAMAREADVAGTPGLVVDGLGGLGGAALWQRDGVVHAVAAPAPLDEVLGVADSLP